MLAQSTVSRIRRALLARLCNNQMLSSEGWPNTLRLLTNRLTTDSTSRQPIFEAVPSGRAPKKLLGEVEAAEVAAYIAQHAAPRDTDELRRVVRNGHKLEREIQTSVGSLKVRRPQVAVCSPRRRNRRPGAI